MLHLTAAVDQLHQSFSFIKTENIAVNEIGRIIHVCSHILLRTQYVFYIKLLCMHGAMTCNIVAILSHCTVKL